jgi:hypothetical protein
MTDADDRTLDPLIGEVVRALDLAVVEWTLEGGYRPLSNTPRWFTGAVPWASLPFLEYFVAEARRYLHDHLGGIIASDQFAVESHGEELLLRARALKIDGRLIVAIERLQGAADMRPVLREARQQALDHETLSEQARAIQSPLARLAAAVERLQASAVADAQRPIVDDLIRSLTRLQDAAAKLPPARKRR